MGAASLFVRTFGDGGPSGTLIFLHATGLNASAYEPMLRALEFPGLVLAPSLRGHGASDLATEPRALRSWWPLAEDVIEEVRARQITGPLTLAGHSLGAVTSLLAARALKPDRLLMIEPVVVPGLYAALARSPLRRLTTDRVSIARRAAARRAQFASRAEVETTYRGKGFFARWDDDAFTGYLDEGLRASAEGVELACTPAWEAACFRAQGHGFWPHLERAIALGTEVKILACERGSTFRQSDHPRARRLGADVAVMAGTHMLPAEEPPKAANWLAKQLA